QPCRQCSQENKNYFDQNSQEALGRKHHRTGIYETRSMRTFCMVTGVRGRSLESRGSLEILSATSWPSTTSPKIVCLLSSQGVAATVMKNWLPFVPGPELAIESFPALECLREGWN